jgi:hypothetical protein
MLQLLFGDFEQRTPQPHRKSTAPIKIASFEYSR